ncbi:MAG: S46 family peptidase [Rhodothermales bacterium]|nr:S46 family peptidase [Rhodothermales bacterium]MBO6779694.1 S46 family peptidase [Rhodothermales bacterium]
MRRRVFVLAVLLGLGTSAGYAQETWMDYSPSRDAVQEALNPDVFNNLVTAQSALVRVAGCDGVFMSGQGLVLSTRSCLAEYLPAGAHYGEPRPLDVPVDSVFDAVHLVFAPEDEVAGFGGRLLYPSYRFDMVLLRLMKADEPIASPVHFSIGGATAGPENRVLEISSGSVSLGEVSGFQFNGSLAMSHTLLFGMLDRYHGNGGREPWSLPAQWADAGQMVDLTTPINLAATTKGRAGAALVNESLEFVGFVLGHGEGAESRSIALDVRGIEAALSGLYPTEGLWDELKGGEL